MSPLDLSRLSGPDAVVALRSYPRRFRTEILPTDDPEIEELAYQVGPDGHSAIDHLVAATNPFVLLGQALHQTQAMADPVVHAAVKDTAQREWDTPPGLTVAGALDRLAEEAEALAARAERLEMGDWNRTAQVVGGGTATAFEIVREAVQAGADHLKGAGADVAAARERRG
jgi:hypothetical protein